MLAIDPEKVCYLIIKAREFDVKVDPVIPEPGGNPADDGEREVLSDYEDDPTYQELVSFLEDLNEDESAAVLALVWLGSGDRTLEEWDSIFADALNAHDDRRPEALLGNPLLSDYLAEGLAQHGQFCEEMERQHL